MKNKFLEINSNENILTNSMTSFNSNSPSVSIDNKPK